MPANVIPGLRRASGFGSVHDVGRLPSGFSDVFESWYVDANGIRLNAVVGAQGRPLLLLGGCPQHWFAWRYLMLPLARQFTVIAADPRGEGSGHYPAEEKPKALLKALQSFSRPTPPDPRP